MENFKRAASGWYTAENIYCIIALYKAQKKRVSLISHNDLDKLYARFLNEIGAAPTTVSLKDKMVRNGDSFFYNSSEDLDIIARFIYVNRFMGGLDKSERVSVCQGIAEAFKTVQFQQDVNLTFDQVEELCGVSTRNNTSECLPATA